MAKLTLLALVLTMLSTLSAVQNSVYTDYDGTYYYEANGIYLEIYDEYAWMYSDEHEYLETELRPVSVCGREMLIPTKTSDYIAFLLDGDDGITVVKRSDLTQYSFALITHDPYIFPTYGDDDPLVCYKPVIYLYPETTTEIEVRLDVDLTCAYPAYDGAWQVTAAPDGTLTDKNNLTYSYLYWEGTTDMQPDMSRGFCVKGSDTAAFLEETLPMLGLNRREANEFIVYWLPLMQSNAYNIISFQGSTYTNAAALDVTPAPDTVIRVFMAWQSVDSPVQIKAQEFTVPVRSGFTLVEWGGTEIK